MLSRKQKLQNQYLRNIHNALLVFRGDVFARNRSSSGHITRLYQGVINNNHALTLSNIEDCEYV